MKLKMDKKGHSHKRSPSSSSSSSSNSSTSSSSSSSSSYDSSHRTGRGDKGSYAKKDNRSSKKSRYAKHNTSSAGTNDRSKNKKVKSGISSSHRSSNFKSSNRKPSVTGGSDYLVKDYDRSSNHKNAHHKRTLSSKILSPVSSSRKSKRQASPSRKRGHNRKESGSRDRPDFHSRALEKSLNNLIASSKPRDPRIEERKRSPDPRNRFGGKRDSPRQYERDFSDRLDKRSPAGSLRLKDNDRKHSQRISDYDHHDRNPYEDRRTGTESRRDDKDKLSRDKKSSFDLHKEKPLDKRAGARFQEDDFLPTRDRDPVPVRRSGPEHEERDYYRRPQQLNSRETSLDRSFDQASYRSRYERTRYDGGRYETTERPSAREYSPVDEDRRAGRPSDPRYIDDHRKRDLGGLDRSHQSDTWVGGDDRGPKGPHEVSVLDRLQLEDHPAEHYGSSSFHKAGKETTWHEPPPSTSILSRTNLNHQQWNKPKKRRNEWQEDYGNEWQDNSKWNQDTRDRGSNDNKSWGRGGRYQQNRSWNESGDKGGEWGGGAAPALSIQQRLGTRVSANRDSNRRNHRKESNQDSLKIDKSTTRRVPSREPEPRITSEIPPLNTSATKISNIESSSPKKIEKELPPPPPPLESLLEKDHFSDFSDDSDDILNQDVPVVEESFPASETKENTTEDLKPAQMATYEEMLEEEDRMDLEEISDDDFEEEKQAKFSVADALDINWSSLMGESNLCPAPVAAGVGSALKRFRPVSLLSRLGVSSKYGNSEFLKELKESCVKRKDDEEKEPEDPVPCEISPVVALHGVVRHLKGQKRERAKIFNHGLYRRVPCAKEDLAIRRRLCNLPEENLIGSNLLLSKQMFKEACNILKSH